MATDLDQLTDTELTDLLRNTGSMTTYRAAMRVRDRRRKERVREAATRVKEQG